MLRSHCSAMIPPALRGSPASPAMMCCWPAPGIVCRRDAIDWQHTGTPHQLGLWRITRRAMRDTGMDQMIAVVLRALVPGWPIGWLSRGLTNWTFCTLDADSCTRCVYDECDPVLEALLT
jgi:hypothetical protein